MKRLIFLIFLLPVILFYQKTEAQVSLSQEEMARKDSVKAHLQKAQQLTQQGKTEEALKIYISIIESEPDNRDAVQGWFITTMRNTAIGSGRSSETDRRSGQVVPGEHSNPFLEVIY